MSHPPNYQLIIEKTSRAKASLRFYLVFGRRKFSDIFFFLLYLPLTSSTRFWQMWSNRYFFCNFILVFSFWCGLRLLSNWANAVLDLWTNGTVWKNILSKWNDFFKWFSFHFKRFSQTPLNVSFPNEENERFIHSNAHNQQPLNVTQFTFNECDD